MENKYLIYISIIILIILYILLLLEKKKEHFTEEEYINEITDIIKEEKIPKINNVVCNNLEIKNNSNIDKLDSKTDLNINNLNGNTLTSQTGQITNNKTKQLNIITNNISTINNKSNSNNLNLKITNLNLSDTLTFNKPFDKNSKPSNQIDNINSENVILKNYNMIKDNSFILGGNKLKCGSVKNGLNKYSALLL